MNIIDTVSCLLNSKWTITEHEMRLDAGKKKVIEGNWWEDDSPFYIEAPWQLLEPICAMQNWFYEKYMVIETAKDTIREIERKLS